MTASRSRSATSTMNRMERGRLASAIAPRIAHAVPGLRLTSFSDTIRANKTWRADMKRAPVTLIVLFLCACVEAQIDKIVIPAGTPEDHARQAVSNEQDAQKKLTMYQDFLQKFSTNPAAVAYGNWQVSQYYQNAGDLARALDY